MKTKLCAALLLVALFLSVTVPVTLQAQQPPTSADSSGPILLSPADLEQLVAPIALYPDPMIALILPAAAVPTDIVLADRYIKNGGDVNGIDAQPWDNNVKGLARYPDVLAMMDENLDWTNQLGAAVLAQQPDVMTAIQAQRAKAQQLGNLQSTPQQKVVVEKQVIQIVPADPQVIYVPVYDPQVVYVQQAPPIAPFITFGAGLAIGAWLAGDCDWHNHGIYYGGYYRPGYGWGYNNVVINNNYYWRPNPHRPPPRPPYRPGRPGYPGGGNGQLPGWRPPPNWGKPGQPGRPGGNRPGDRPTIQPYPNPGRPNQPNNPYVPAKPGAKPGQGGNPSIQPHPGPGQTKPAPGYNKPGIAKPGELSPPPTNPGFNHGKPNSKGPVHSLPTNNPYHKPTQKPVTTQPHVQPKPAVQPRPQPKPQPRPQPKPAVQHPAPRPAPQHKAPAQRPANAQRSPYQR